MKIKLIVTKDMPPSLHSDSLESIIALVCGDPAEFFDGATWEQIVEDEEEDEK